MTNPTKENRNFHSAVVGQSTDWLRNLNKDVKKSNYKRTEEARRRDKARRSVSDMLEFDGYFESIKEVWE